MQSSILTYKSHAHAANVAKELYKNVCGQIEKVEATSLYKERHLVAL